MPKIDPESVPFVRRTGYPPPFDEAVAGPPAGSGMRAG